MKKRIALFFATCAILGVSFSGCSSLSNSGLAADEINKPADYWYHSMLKEINSNDLEKADSYFSSLQTEHINSPLLSEAMLILGKAHMKNEEYELAAFYFDEYIRRFGNTQNIDFARYLKIQANFFAFSRKHRDQQLLLKSIKDAEEFSEKYQYSRYRPAVDTMLLKMELANASLNSEIAALYSRRGKPLASEFYKQKAGQKEWLKNVYKKEAGTPWYSKIFEW